MTKVSVIIPVYNAEKYLNNCISSIANQTMKDLEITITSIEWVVENNNKFLKIELDRVNGLDLDAVVEATNIINPILDDADLIKEEYILDISSRERG